MDYRNAFLPWRGLGTNYEGGVLPESARIAVAFTHRLGALVTALLLLLAAGGALAQQRDNATRTLRSAAIAVLAALALQLAIGVLMVRKAFPLPLATAHNAGAALLLLATCLLIYRLRRPLAPQHAATMVAESPDRAAALARSPG